jgi:predicted nuclease of predicted toxin-antitoxin system
VARVAAEPSRELTVAAFLVDESLPRAVTRALVVAGHDVVDVRDVGLRGATDDAIAARARATSSIVVSGDLDFSNALRFPPGTHPGIVVARLPDAIPPADMAARIVAAIAAVGADLAGAITIVEATRVRVFGTGDLNRT